MTRMTFRLALSLIAVSAGISACVSKLSIQHSACPCADGWICCDGQAVCVRPGESCQGYTPPTALTGYADKVDLLLVIDNSASMTDAQNVMRDSVRNLIDDLVAHEYDYRIGVVSTDTLGFNADCNGARLDVVGSLGDCTRPEVVLRRPHDGAKGRLLAAYDPRVFDASSYEDLSPELQQRLALLFPTGVNTSPLVPWGEVGGVPWFVKGSRLRVDACWACGCTECRAGNECFDQCVGVLEREAAAAYVRSNLSGLGLRGQGWEQGLKAALLAVGVDPENADDQAALNPPDSLTAPQQPNTDATGPWLRDDARLVVLFVSNEEDCSMPADMWINHCAFEDGCGEGWVPPPDWFPNPPGSMCYQQDVQVYLHAPERMASLLKAKKGCPEGWFNVGFVGGVSAFQSANGTTWAATDCAVTQAGETTSTCSCLDGVSPQDPECDLWCLYTKYKSESCERSTQSPPSCQALAGSRYVRFVNSFDHSAYWSICGFSNPWPLATGLFPWHWDQEQPSQDSCAPVASTGNSSGPEADGCTCFVTASDVDGDCIEDALEIANGNSDPTKWDTDGDGIGDGCEDRNRDGLREANEEDPRNPDTDGDDIPDGLEDTNKNGRFDPGETSAIRADTDYDGIPDGVEDWNHNGIVDAWIDVDGDSCFTAGVDIPGETDPRRIDSDRDGIPDNVEDANLNGLCEELETCAWLADTDCDGLMDGKEDTNQNGRVDTAETDPLVLDTDGDGLIDGVEDANHNGYWDIGYETSPLSIDSDGDEIPDGIEDGNHNGIVDPFQDSNHNGCWDAGEIAGESDPRSVNTDDDGIPDNLEDRNHNGICDFVTMPAPTDPGRMIRVYQETCAFSADTDCDGIKDTACPGGTNAECPNADFACVEGICVLPCTDGGSNGVCIIPSGCPECQEKDGNGQCVAVGDACSCHTGSKLCNPNGHASCPFGQTCDTSCGCVPLPGCTSAFNPDGSATSCTAALQCCQALPVGQSCCLPDETAECFSDPETGENRVVCMARSCDCSPACDEQTQYCLEVSPSVCLCQILPP